MRQVHVRALIAESELQHCHPRNVVTIAQGVDIGSNEPEIFGEERQPAQCVANSVEEFVSWTVDPAAMNSGGFVSRNFPELRKTAKVIEPDVVAGLRRPAQTTDPPTIAPRPHYVPVVQRISPALSGGAERVRRNSGHHLGLKVLFQPK